MAIASIHRENAWAWGLYQARQSQMHKCSCVINLTGRQTKDERWNQHQSNSSPVHNWGKGIKEINTFDLSVTTNTESWLEFTNGAIRILFTFECPSRRKYVHPRFMKNYIPCVFVSTESIKFLLTGFPISISIRAIHSLFPCRSILRVCFSSKNHWIQSIQSTIIRICIQFHLSHDAFQIIRRYSTQCKLPIQWVQKLLVQCTLGGTLLCWHLYIMNVIPNLSIRNLLYDVHGQDVQGNALQESVHLHHLNHQDQGYHQYHLPSLPLEVTTGIVHHRWEQFWQQFHCHHHWVEQQ